jgi:hypothetical protein
VAPNALQALAAMTSSLRRLDGHVQVNVQGFYEDVADVPSEELQA